MSDTSKATPIKWSIPSDPKAWPETGQVMNAQEAAVAFNALIGRLTHIDKVALELAEEVETFWKNIDRTRIGEPNINIPAPSRHKARQLLKLYEEKK